MPKTGNQTRRWLPNLISKSSLKVWCQKPPYQAQGTLNPPIEIQNRRARDPSQQRDRLVARYNRSHHVGPTVLHY